MTSPAHSADSASAFELKGSALTLMVLSLHEGNSALIASQLSKKFGQAPGFFRNAPLLLDLSALRASSEEIDFPFLASTLRTLGFVPVAVRGGSEVQQTAALGAGLGLLPESRGGRTGDIPDPDPSPAPTTAATPQRVPAKVVAHPVRSGQRIVAPEGDLVVLAPVGAGSEIVAGGNIHVYGPLRGRALAGARGDTAARIFCLQFAPELVAIAGEYLVNEELEQGHLGKSVQVFLENDKLKVEPF